MQLRKLLQYTPQTSKLQIILRILLGIFLLFTGISHLSFLRVEFLAQVPDWVPIDPDLVVVLSGIAEILLGVMLVFLKRYQVIVGILTSLFFIAIFPGNISQYVNGIDAFGLNSDTSRFIRLFFQPVFIIWALWSTDFFKAYHHTADTTS
ncbi:MAG: hypothetical protein INQ03_09620 [Candidatus Heimdallarchaeota archaeon]|nr:hypothetical protein [Candidatus Heimdallarchaeota archaeon]